ncbi:MAG: hypothetical protein ACM3UU_01130 [Ignavibacteriales bacterium]
MNIKENLGNIFAFVVVVVVVGAILGAIGWGIACNSVYEPTLIAEDKGDEILVTANFPFTGHGKLFFEYHHVSLTTSGAADVSVASNQVDAKTGTTISLKKPYGSNAVRLTAHDRAFMGPSSKDAVLNW